jgi:hypothetical protein
MDEGGMLIINAGNSSDVTGGCFVLVVGFGGVKTICERRPSVLAETQIHSPPALHENNSREIMSESGSFVKPGNG